MFSGLQRGNGNLGMSVIGGADRDQFHLLILNHFAPVITVARKAEISGALAGPFRT